MEEYKVLITTSGVGSRLGNLTEKTNKCLVRISDKPSISHIIESYPKETKFVITLGYFGDYVRQYLNIAHPNSDFTFVEIDNYNNQGSSLGYSISKCEEHLGCPFIFHASDTIIDKLDKSALFDNWVIGSSKKDASQYRTINIEKGLIKNINEKGEINFDCIYVGVCGIKDYKLFFKYLKEELGKNTHDLSDVHIISKMIKDVDFKCIEVDSENWFDIGNVEELERTRKAFSNNVEVLDKSDESIFFFDDSVIKFFSNKAININRVKRAKMLDSLVPNLISHSDNFYKYKKAEGNLFSESVNSKKFYSFLEWSKNNLWVKKEVKDFGSVCEKFYIEKTKKRIYDYLKGENDSACEINGLLIPGIYELLDSIDKDWLCDGIPCQFHGDFILDNIIEKNGNFTLIDWRQDFGGCLDFGDLYYDLSKLNHNLYVNHKIVNMGLFSHKKDECHILTSTRLIECKKILKDFVIKNNLDWNKVEVLTSLIWLNMAPLHEYPFNVFLFNFGKYNLFKNLNNNI